MTRFADLEIGTYFVDEEGETCLKVGALTARSRYCAPGFCEGWRPDEPVTPIPRPSQHR